MDGAIKIWSDVLAWATGWFVKILDSFGGWSVYVLSVLIFSAVGALVVPAFSGSLNGDDSDHKPPERPQRPHRQNWLSRTPYRRNHD